MQDAGFDADFIRPVYRGEPGHPVILNPEWIPYIMNYNGPEGLKGAIERSCCIVKELEVEDRGTILDNDTKQDFERTMIWYRRKELVYK